MSRFKSSGWKTPSPSRATTSSIRGKISGPIPIPDDDDEFPIRAAGVTMATPLGDEGNEKQLRLSPPRPGREMSPGPREERVPPEFMGPTRAAPEAPAPNRLSFDVPSRQTTEINLGLVARDRGLTTTPAPVAEKPQRQKSTLKSVLGRIFGGKKRKSGGTDTSKKSGTAQQRLHHSDPSALRGPKEQNLSQQRSTSMPINEFNRALRSHSVVLDENLNLNLGQERTSASPADRRNRPRRATTPSRILTPTGGPGKDWGLAPRPPSGHVRSSQSFDNGPIGYALTSGSHPNRKSRSLDHLRGIAGYENEGRRRSDEIKYWRESYDPDALSPISSQKPDGGTPVLADGNMIMLEPEPEPQTPPQPFNFGPLGEMAGMKITQAASLETRVSRIEEALQRMERTVQVLQSRISGGPLYLQDLSRGNNKSKSWGRPGTDSSGISGPPNLSNPRIYQQKHYPQADTSFASTHKRSHESSRPSTMSTHNSYHQPYEELSPRPTFISSPQQPPHLDSTNDLSVSNSDTIGRPLSTSTTIRGMASSSPEQPSFPLSKQGSLTAHHYSALLNLIQAESATRQQLEAQVMMLRHQLHAALSGSTIPYPTPSPDSRVDINRSDRNISGDHDGKGRGASRQELSTFDHEGSDSDSEYETKEEDFMTPTEKHRHDARDEYEREMGHGEESLPKPRTLSLSHLTLGKGPLQSVNFRI